MSAEYLIFDALILLPTFALAMLGPWVSDRVDVRRMFVAAIVASVPFIVWDAAVTGHHWSFNPAYITGVRAFGLPLEELLFFVAVPFACLFTWTAMTPRAPAFGSGARGSASTVAAGAAVGLVVAGTAFLISGVGYTGTVLVAAGIAVVLDRALGTRVVQRAVFLRFAALVVVLTGVFNGYLTARPVVLYNPAEFLGLRIGTIPIEDFVYGLSLMTAVTASYEWLRSRKTTASWVGLAIERRMGGYVQTLAPTPSLALAPAVSSPVAPRRVAVIGGGLAGISTASYLAEAGLQVALFERNEYLGGKVAGWRVEQDGISYPVEHGFHAFFRHYHNLNDYLERIGADRFLRSVEQYTILTRDGREIQFDEARNAPALNLIDLARRGLYDVRNVASPRTVSGLLPLLQYDEERTFAEFDNVSYQDFARELQLPDDLSLTFTTFARAFFADADRLSLAEVIKSFHFYYLSHDLGLVYDYLDGSVEDTLLPALTQDLVDRGVDLRLGQTPDPLQEHADGGFSIGSEHFDDVVIATDAEAARKLLEASTLPTSERLQDSLPVMRAGQRYAVWRLWLPIPVREDLPVFVATQRDRVLDAVAFFDRIDPELQEWAERRGGSVVELHCYAVPDALSEQELREHFRRELAQMLDVPVTVEPEFEFLRVGADFTALHVGMHARRPTTQSGVDGLYFAGDWVRLPCPAMLMEAAQTSGRLAANAILSKLGHPCVPVRTVPRVGLLTRNAA